MRSSTALRLTQTIEGLESFPQATTLLDAVQAVCEVTEDDREVVATIRHMLRSGRIRLIGNFAGSRLGADD